VGTETSQLPTAKVLVRLHTFENLEVGHPTIPSDLSHEAGLARRPNSSRGYAFQSFPLMGLIETVGIQDGPVYANGLLSRDVSVASSKSEGSFLNLLTNSATVIAM
jgi:hypothetical protein